MSKGIDRILKAFGLQRTARRAYAAAKYDRLTQDWINVTSSIDQDIRNGLVPVRQRARDLVQNNDYAKKYMKLLRVNVPGPTGFYFQSKVTEFSGAPDTVANSKIEEAWALWSKASNCTVTGRQSLRSVQDILIQALGRDGEGMLRLVYDRNAYCGFRIEIIPPELIDEMYNTKLANGNIVKMGVEVNPFGRHQAYWIRQKNQLDLYGSTATASGLRDRIPASEIIYGFDQEFPAQTRGISWLVQSMLRLRMLSGYEEAAVVNARVSASKVAFYKRTPGAQGDILPDAMEGDQKIIDAEPGQFGELPMGYDIATWDPKYPDQQHEMFMRSNLRGISSGLGVAASSLSNDLSDVNYSSIRAGLVEEREQYKLIQQWFIETFLEPLYTVWLESAIMSGAINLPMSKFDKFNKPQFIGRRWAWVDPLKDVEANEMELRLKTKAPSQIVAEQGGDFEEVLQQWQIDQGLLDKYGMELEYSKGGAQNTPEPAPAEPTKPTNGNGKSLIQKVTMHKELIG